MLNLIGLAKQFDARPILRKVDLELRGGNVALLVGLNGSGKSTLIDIISGFIRPDGGHVVLNGCDITGWPAHQIRRMGIARTFQREHVLPSLSALDNVVLGSRNNVAPARRAWPPYLWPLLDFGDEGRELIRVVGRLFRDGQQGYVRLRAARLLNSVGLEKYHGAPAGELSYGQQKLVALARCLASRAEVLLLDEPLAGIAPELRQQIWSRLLEERSEERLLIVTEHDSVELLPDVDVVLNLHDGALCVVEQVGRRSALSKEEQAAKFIGECVG